MKIKFQLSDVEWVIVPLLLQLDGNGHFYFK